MKKTICLLAVLSLTACGGDNNSASTSDEKNGTFKATMGDKKFEVAVSCHHFDSDKFDTEFMFASDNGFGNQDTDGDGIIVRGDRVKIGKDKSPLPMDGMSLDVVIDDVRYSANLVVASLEKRNTWTKNANGITGEDKLMKDDDPSMKGYPITYEVICK
jgi:hypothetical protein